MLLPKGSRRRGLPTERPTMNDNQRAACDRDTRLENFAAELTSAAYPLALHQGMRGSWIKVESGLWRALAQTVKKWARLRPAGSSDELKAWREGLLVDLTGRAFSVAVEHGIKGSPLEVEQCLYRAFRSVIEGIVAKGRQDVTPTSAAGEGSSLREVQRKPSW